MRKLGATGMAAALCAGLVVATARAGDGDGGDLRALPPVKPSWWSGMFGGKEAAAPAKKQPRAEVPPPPRPRANDPATILDREQNALQRRQAVCDDLRAIAVAKNDDALLARIDQMEEKAIEVYKQRTATIGGLSADAAALTRPAKSAPDASGRAAARDSEPGNQREDRP